MYFEEHGSGTFDLLHAFMNQSRDFTLGFEVGSFYQQLTSGDAVEGMFHVSNEGELLRLARRVGFTRVHWEGDDYWASGRFEPLCGGPTTYVDEDDIDDRPLQL